MASGLYISTFADQWNATQLAINWVSSTAGYFKVALYTSSYIPTGTNFALSGGDTAYGVGNLASGQSTGTGYSAGGANLSTPNLFESSGSLVWDANDVSWTSSTIAEARGALVYSASVSNRAMLFVDFGSNYSTSNGTFTIGWSSVGIVAIDLTP